MKTSCRFCEFNVKDGTIQVGCEAGLLDKYSKKGIPIVPVRFDDERGVGEAFEIDRLCLSLRMPGWKEAKKKQGLLINGKTYADIARDELDLSTTMLFNIPTTSTFKDVVECVDRVNHFERKPNHLLFMNHSSIRPVQFLSLNNLTKIPWNLEHMLELAKSEEEYRERSFNLGSKKVKTAFMVTADVGVIIRPDYLKTVFERIVDDLESFVAIRGKEVNFYQTAVYRFVRGEEQASAHEKIELLAESQECLHLLKNESEIFHS